MNAATRLEPLTCQSCRAPVPLGAGDDVRCPSCEASQPLPEAYRALRDARRLSADAARELDALCAEVARPPAPWKRVAIFVGYGVGILTLVILAIGALVGAIAGIVAAAKVEAGDTIAAIIIGVCVTVCGLVSVPLVGEFVVLVVQLRDFDEASRALAGTSRLELDLWVGAALYLFSVVPIGLAYTTQVKLKGLDALRAQLAAKPPSPGGSWECRSCGAPLVVTAGALATRCLYCGTESLVNGEAKTATKEKTKAKRLSTSVQEALDTWNAARREDRKLMWSMLVAGPLLAPLVALGGAVFHALWS